MAIRSNAESGNKARLNNIEFRIASKPTTLNIFFILFLYFLKNIINLLGSTNQYASFISNMLLVEMDK